MSSNVVKPVKAMGLEGHVISYDLESKTAVFKATRPIKAKLRIRFRNHPDFELALLEGQYHHILSVDLHKNPFPSNKNFRMFDYDQYLYANGFIGQYALIDFDTRPSDLNLASGILRLKTKVSKRLEERHAPQTYGFIKALLFAEKKDFLAYDAFKDLGLAHLFAVSGLHFGLIYGTLNKVVKWGPRLVSAFLKLFVLLGFLIWIGDSYSAQRAFWLICYIEIGGLLDKKIDGLSALAFSSLMILLFKPYAILSTSFQLSFYAYFMIAMVYKRRTYRSKVLKNLHFVIWIQGLLLPSTLYYFQSAYAFGFLTNLIMVPMMGLLLPLMILDVLLGWSFFSYISEPLLRGSVNLLTFLIERIRFIPMPTWWFKQSDFLWVICLCGVYLLLSVFNAQSIKRQVLIKRFVALGFCLMLTQEIAQVSHQIHFVDVGDGDFALIKARAVNVLIDSGEGFVSPSTYLKHHDVERLEALILSHAHKDHYGGLSDLLASIPIKRIYLNEETHQAVMTDLAFYEGEVVLVENPLRLSWEKEKLSIDLFPTFSKNVTNDNGVSAFVKVNDFTGYFLGDLHNAGVNALTYSDTFDFLKVPHHGSKTSSDNKLYEASRFSYGIISHGVRYRFPNTETIDALNRLDAQMLSTYSQGGLVIDIRRNRHQIKHYLGKGDIPWIFQLILKR